MAFTTGGKDRRRDRISWRVNILVTKHAIVSTVGTTLWTRMGDLVSKELTGIFSFLFRYIISYRHVQPSS